MMAEDQVKSQLRQTQLVQFTSDIPINNKGWLIKTLYVRAVTKANLRSKFIFENIYYYIMVLEISKLERLERMERLVQVTEP